MPLLIKSDHAPYPAVMACRLQLLVFFLALYAVLLSLAETKKLEETSSFDVKPTGSITHQTIELSNKVKCVFTYTTVGGTNEEWTMSLKKTKKGAYKCTVERPDQASYLYFMNFAMSILEHDVVKAEVFDNNGAILQDEEYIITKDLKSVAHKDGGFQSNLVRVMLIAREPKANKEL